MGCLFKKTWKDANGNVKESPYWSIKYYANGKQKYHYTKETNKRKARETMLQLEADASKGGRPWKFDKVTFDELADDLILSYEIKGNRSIPRLKRSIKALKSYFEGIKVQNLSTSSIRRYTKERSVQGFAHATINRELAALKTMLRLGKKDGKVYDVPHIEMLQEDNVKEGYVTYTDFEALYEKLPYYLRRFAKFTYITGMRREEVAELQIKHVNLDKGEIRLESRETKGGETRIIPLVGEIKEIIEFQLGFRKKSKILSPYIFPNRDRTNRIRDFRTTWNKACRGAGLGYGYKLNGKYVEKWMGKLPPGPTMHDFRRSMATNAIEAGIPEKVIMELGGWKTRSVFQRYHIVKKDHLARAIEQQQEYFKTQKGKSSSSIVPVQGKV